jgi:hypothetical protein
MTLEELYSRKITKSTEEAIEQKESFDKISDNWCSKVCKLCKKSPSNSNLFIEPTEPTEPTDVLIVQDYNAFDDVKFKRTGQQTELTHRGVIHYIQHKAFRRELTWDLTNLLKCPISKEDIKPGGKPPTDTVLAKCKPYLLSEIRKRKPKVIISLSTVVTKALGIKASNYTNRGEIFSFDGIPVVLTLHPRILLMLRQNSSGKFWGPDFFSTIVKDFEKAKGLVLGNLPLPSLERGLEKYGKMIWVARDLTAVKGMVTNLLKASEEGYILSFDTETTGLDPMAPDARILTVQFGWKSEENFHSYVIPLWHKDNTNYNPNEAWALVIPLLGEEVTKVAHNGKFDILYVYHTCGVRVKGVVFDTMLLLHSLNSGLQGMYGLKKAVHDWIPEMEIGGYEDKLPKLTKTTTEEVEEGEGDE